MLKSSLCDCSDVYILVKGENNRGGADAIAREADARNKGVIFKNCVPFTDCMSDINNL